MKIILTNLGFLCKRKHLVFIMRTFIFLFCATVFSFTSNNVVSQNSKVKIEEDKVLTVDEVFEIIKNQTDYKFIYEVGIFKNFPKVEVKKGIISTNALLNKSLSGGHLNIIVTKDNTIIIKDAKTAQQTQVTGIVTDGKNLPIPGVTVFIKGTGKGTATNFDGSYTITVPNPENVLVFSALGYATQEITVGNQSTINVSLKEGTEELKEVEIVYSTGYQEVAKERATGSFEKLDQKLFNYKSGTDVIARLEGLTTGILINKSSGFVGDGNLANMTIRGPSDLGWSPMGDRRPLIILDNMPYEGDINNINPYDIKSITILKDAAAASIWGARAGNGVIVINTKKGVYAKKMQINIHHNTIISQKPDLFYKQNVSPSEFIDLETDLYNKGLYQSDISNTWMGGSLLSPVIQILDKRDKGLLTDTQANNQINAMRNYDLRNEMLKYYYRNQIIQQYAIDISEGNDNFNYFLSTGFDKELGNRNGSKSDRISIKSNINFKPIRNLEMGVNLLLTQRNTTDKNNLLTPIAFQSGYYPYARLADDMGNPLPLMRDYRIEWAQEQGDIRGLDWTYVPLNDIDEFQQESKNQDVLLNFSTKYQINSIFNAEVAYQHEKSNSDAESYFTEDSYYMRDLINRFTYNPGPEQIRYLPLGGKLDLSNSSLTSNKLRGLLNAEKTWNEKHQLSAIFGAEISEDVSKGNSYLPIYGYNPDNLSTRVLDFNQYYPNYNLDFYQTQIPWSPYSFSENTRRTTSVFTNVAYSYDNRYIISASARRDGSNLFGVKTNQKFNPFWSLGSTWNISNEAFYKSEWIPNLKLRATYGYSGNVNTSLTADLTIQDRGNDYQTQRPYATIQNLPNSELRWMKVGMLNIGLDFGLKNNRFFGSIEYYNKKSTDVYGPLSLDPTFGKNYQILNSGEIEGKGIDISLNSINVKKDEFSWTSNLLFSFNTNKVTKYEIEPMISVLPDISNGDFVPVEGHDAYGLYSFNFAGLDPQTGDPMGYDEDGNLTSVHSYNSYTLNPKDVKDLVYHGSSVPTYYGSFRNSLNWKNLEFSFNIMYKFGYYIRKSTIEYNGIKNNWSNINSDINDRWQNPGDEATTTIPSMPDNLNDWTLGYRDKFYKYSTATVAKGDHIRLQDINLSYKLGKRNNIRLYTNLANLGILWKANNLDLDPDFSTVSYPNPLTMTIGFSANF